MHNISGVIKSTHYNQEKGYFSRCVPCTGACSTFQGKKGIILLDIVPENEDSGKNKQ